jgi:hypothetical protein
VPQNITIAAFILGAVLLLIALIGGRFKIFGAEVSGTVGRAGRLAAGVAGTVLIIIGLFGVPRVDVTRLTESEQKEFNIYLEMARWSQDHNHPRQALGFYRKALEIDKDNPEIPKAIETLQKKIGGN